MNQKSSANTLITNTGWVYTGKIVTQLFSLVTSILVIRQLPIDIYGAFTFAFGLYAFFQLFIYSPLQYVVIRFLPEMRAKGHFSAIRRLIVSSSGIALFSTLILILLMHLFESHIIRWFNIIHFEDYRSAFYLFVVFYSLKLLIEMMMMAFLMHRVTAILNILMFASRSILYIVFLKQLDVNLLLRIEYFLSLGYFLSAAILLIKIKPDHRAETATIDETRYLVRIKRFWLYSIFAELGAGLIGRTSDYYIISAMSGSFQVGLYGFAIKIYEIFYKILPVKEFDSVLRPLFFNRFNQETPDEVIQSFYNFMVKMMMPIFIFPFIYFLIFGQSVIVHVFDPRYIDSYAVTCIILLGIVINGLFYPLNMMIQLKEQVQINLYSRIVVLFSILAGILLMKHYGIIGIAIATLTGDLLKNLIMLVLFRRYVPIVYPGKDLMRYLALTIIPIILFFPITFWYQNLLISTVGSLLFGVVYCILTINTISLNEEERQMTDKLLSASKKMTRVQKHLLPIIQSVRFIS